MYSNMLGTYWLWLLILGREELRGVGHDIYIQQHALHSFQHFIWLQLLCTHVRWIFSFHVVEAKSTSFLQWLNSSLEEQVHNGCTSYSHELQCLD